jgi:actin related protein 2/3 complex subunit 3
VGIAQHTLTCTQAYHSALNEEPDIRQVGNLGIYPIKTRLRGPAPVAGIYSHPLPVVVDLSIVSASNAQGDIIDETLDLFRANSLFRNFEIKGPGDRLLIILILFISDCLAKLGSARTTPTQIEATKTLNTLAVDNFPVPGDANFLLNAHYAPPASRADAGNVPLFWKECVVVYRIVRLPSSISSTSPSRTRRSAC